MIPAFLPLASNQPWWVLGFALLIGHAAADYPLQGEFLALGKNHRNVPEWRHVKPESMRGLWFHCLTAHSLIHAGVVWAISGVFALGVIEFVLHWILDFLKSAGLTNLHFDQLLHVLCKVAYVAILQFGLFWN
jgi:hypothetical protein